MIKFLRFMVWFDITFVILNLVCVVLDLTVAGFGFWPLNLVAAGVLAFFTRLTYRSLQELQALKDFERWVR